MALIYNTKIVTGRFTPEGELVYVPPPGPGGDYPADMPVAYQPALPLAPTGTTIDLTSGDYNFGSAGDSNHTYRLTANVGSITFDQDVSQVVIDGQGLYSCDRIVLNSSFGINDPVEDFKIKDITCLGVGGNAIGMSVGGQRIHIDNVTVPDTAVGYGIWGSSHAGATPLNDIYVTGGDIASNGTQPSIRFASGSKLAIWGGIHGEAGNSSVRFHSRGDLGHPGTFLWMSDTIQRSHFWIGYPDRPGESEFDNVIVRRNNTVWEASGGNLWFFYCPPGESQALGTMSNFTFEDNTFDSTAPGVTDGGTIASGQLSGMVSDIAATTSWTGSGNSVTA